MILLLTLVIALASFGQVPRASGVVVVFSAPSGGCPAGSPLRNLSPSNSLYSCVLSSAAALSGTWTALSGGGGGGGTVTSVSTTSPISGGPITGSGSISCPTCLVGNQTITLSGDASGSGTTAITVMNGKVNGVSYSASPSTDTTPIITAANTASYVAINDCTGAGMALTYAQSGHSYGCNTISGSATYPSRATIWMDESTVTAGGGTVAFDSETAQPYAALWYISSQANADAFTNSFMLTSGTYTFSVLGATFTNRAKVDWYIDGTMVISGQDWYTGVAIFDAIKTASVTVSTSGYHQLKGIINGKNASSSGFVFDISKIWLKPAAD